MKKEGVGQGKGDLENGPTDFIGKVPLFVNFFN